MSLLLEVLEAGFILLGAVACVISVVGIAFSKDPFAQLIYGSIASGGALVAIVAGVAINQGASITTLQGVVVVVLMIPSSAIAAHRIAAVMLDRSSSPPQIDETVQ